ncbi:kinase-like domain-containing protein [Ochromonadaceae sp. CCMP2298]|nr:kinase-like domain-containing protein [Ochromonadaceae sp. CCMP2298]|mmetsp:Transcript_13943/g.30782  ORF Transcript_13943/g.30782 Transcript_13943/m.30782 type:complete len:616 (+) Transcript_13943:107-1954(+)
MSTQRFAVYGDISIEEIKEAISKNFPEKRVSVQSEAVSKSREEKLEQNDIILSSSFPGQGELYELKCKELKDAEESASKALLSIQTFHKQQQALFDEFVLLRQRYDEQKSSTVNILWTHCTKYHPDLRQIPVMQDASTFVEVEDQVGDYNVGELLGEGQFATVKDCSLEGQSTEYALKIIKKERITSFTALMRVSNEIDNLLLLKNKHIVNIVHVLHTEKKLYIVTEKGGRDLFDFFDEHPDGVPEEWAKQIIICVLKGVMFCHDHGICHRDLKPENILLSFDAEAGKCTDLKLCDFGLSTRFKPKTLLTDFCGSPGFFAPEMIIYGSYYGDKADVWSTGCILLELMAGHEKFCDVWMTAYDYEILQDKKHFTETIQETVDQLPSVLNFSPALNNFILQFLDLRTNKRPHVSTLCSDPWLEGRIEEDLTHRNEKLAETGTTRYPKSPSITRTNSQSSLDLVSLGLADDNVPFDRHYVEMMFSNFTERERHHMEQYIKHHADDSPGNRHAQMHLPPIVPATPNISGAKKIFDRGNDGYRPASMIIDQLANDDSRPTSPGPLQKIPSFQKNESRLPGVTEGEQEHVLPNKKPFDSSKSAPSGIVFGSLSSKSTSLLP